ncbi:MAG: 6-phospho-3-hexuloisomerase [Syntrophobacteria bacterium]
MRQLRSPIKPGTRKTTVNEKLEAILAENRCLLQGLSDEAMDDLIQRILKARAIFFSAQGRSGYILRCFCMRLMHLGYQVYFCGETVTPAICQGDLLVVLSGSGETPSTLEAVKIAKRRNAVTCGIVGNPDSRIAARVDVQICLPGTTKLRRSCEPPSFQMAGSLFEQSAFLFLEGVVLAIYQRQLEEPGILPARHAVIE